MTLRRLILIKEQNYIKASRRDREEPFVKPSNESNPAYTLIPWEPYHEECPKRSSCARAGHLLDALPVHQ